MKAAETSLRNLLEGTKQFQIPLFQRPYSWKKENWEVLWADLMSLYKDKEIKFGLTMKHLFRELSINLYIVTV
ncbi:MAG TPA: hypothetical protein DCL61_15220 [Cyanobacteria bacterium UBA12227]|nr:hypothetical protein [Cyanobacteria bacterium UBA12227]HAX89132.1 hypothetical protein [Cyanobacteria bacterium UBA11370]HBY77249.1 hypothetical protein [Cyanobacteria bacterium UBA11148]